MASRRDVHEQIKNQKDEGPGLPVDSADTEAPVNTVVPPASDSGAKTDEAKPAKEKAAPKEPVDCKCEVPDNGKVVDGKAKYPGCNGAKSTRLFAPGHDAKLVGYLTREYAAGTRTAESVIEEVKAKSNNSGLLVNKVKKAIKVVDERKAAATRKELAAKEKAEAAKPATEEADVNDQAIALAETGATV